MARRTMDPGAPGELTLADLRRGRRGRRLTAMAGATALAMALLAPTAVFASTPTATAGASTPEDAGCPGHWPASVAGVPATYHAGASAGDYIWHDAKGWHLRVTKKTKTTAVFTGRITSDKPMTVRGAFLDKGDSFTVSNGGRTLTYRFVNHGRLDGLDIRTACASKLVITGSINGHRLSAKRVWIGAAGAHPLGVPFAILHVP